MISAVLIAGVAWGNIPFEGLFMLAITWVPDVVLFIAWSERHTSSVKGNTGDKK